MTTEQEQFTVPDVPDDGSWDDIVNPPATGDKTYFGHLSFAREDVALIKGVGRVPFDPTHHDEGQRQISVAMKLEPLERLDGPPVNYTIDRDALNWSKEMKEIVLPSLAAVGWDLRVKRENWCQVQMRKFAQFVGRDGETKDKTVFHVVAVYPDEAACRAASDAFWESRRRGEATDAPPVAAANGSAGTAATTGGSDPAEDRRTALRFLRLTVKAANGNLSDLAAKLEADPLFRRAGITIESPEVEEAWGKAEAARAAAD